MYVILKKEHIEELYQCVKESADSACSIINTHVHDDELAAALKRKFWNIQYCLKDAYDPELVELKRRARLYYKRWLALRDIDTEISNEVYKKYHELKCKVKEMEIPF